jgi:thioredoxin-related protein
MRRLLVLVLLLLASSAHGEAPSLPWAKWDPGLFDRARREDKYILLHMAAVWCHWCHVMEETTYRDPDIQRRILEKFIPVRVDQDADPALSYRYENWGWPATIMLDKDGNEIFKRRGYIPPELFGKLLTAVIDDPSALPSVATPAVVADQAALSPERRQPAKPCCCRATTRSTAVSATPIASFTATRWNGRSSAAVTCSATATRKPGATSRRVRLPVRAI